MLHKTLGTLMLMVLLIPTQAQPTPETIIEQFFKTYNQSPTQAIDYVFSTNEWMDQNQDAVENVKTQLSGTLKLIGPYYGQEKISERQAGENYKQYTYMVKYDRQPLRFTFIFYRPTQDRWQVQNFRFDDGFDEELK